MPVLKHDRLYDSNSYKGGKEYKFLIDNVLLNRGNSIPHTVSGHIMGLSGINGYARLHEKEGKEYLTLSGNKDGHIVSEQILMSDIGAKTRGDYLFRVMNELNSNLQKNKYELSSEDISKIGLNLVENYNLKHGLDGLLK